MDLRTVPVFANSLLPVQRLLVATRNPHKTREIQQILGREFEVIDLLAHPELPDTEETGKTFEENAVLKAVTASSGLPDLVMADDSGLEVNALEGAPGVRSARYAGENATDAANVTVLLQALEGIEDRSARFRCVLVLAQDGAVISVFEGTIAGVITRVARGDGGFGYDPIFVPEGFGQTFAELTLEVKNRISHRAQALEKLVQHFRA